MIFSDIKTASDLKGFCDRSHDLRHFFDRSTMRFFGDTMRNFGIRKHNSEGWLVIELYRKKPVKHGLQKSHYFIAGDEPDQCKKYRGDIV